jgi:hypothetical protein
MNERGASDLIVVLSFGSVMIGWVILGGMFSPNDGVSGIVTGCASPKLGSLVSTALPAPGDKVMPGDDRPAPRWMISAAGSSVRPRDAAVC